MKITTLFANSDHTESLMQNLFQQTSHWNEAPSVMVVYFNSKHSPDVIQTSLNKHFACPFIMASSCKGAFAISGDTLDSGTDIAVFAIFDPDGNYGIGHAELNEISPQESSSQALAISLSETQIEFETPSMIWSVMLPGKEEFLLDGIASVIGPNVPVFGGSSADNEVSGDWYQGSHKCLGQNLVICLAMHPSKPISASYSSGYQPTETKLIASDCDERELGKLNGLHAATVYNGLTNKSISHALKGGNVLADTTLHPLGKKITSPTGISEYLLCHPDAVTSKSGLSLFSNVENNQTFYLMEGSVEGLVNRANVVIQNAIQMLPEGNTPCGILLIYCAGCMLTIGDGVEKMQREVKKVVGNIPVCGAYTFGEQGCFLDGKNRHGNLMISAVIFSK